jgi:hypothetical protein
MKWLRFTTIMYMSVIASAGINQPASGQVPPSISRDVCKIFASTHLKECGGSARDSSIGTQWNAGRPELGIAAFNSTVLSNLEGLQFTQDQFVTSWSDAGATIDDTSIVVLGCRQARLAVARSDVIVEAHGTGNCHGFAVNFFVSGSLFTDLIEVRFKNAIAALARDKLNYP